MTQFFHLIKTIVLAVTLSSLLTLLLTGTSLAALPLNDSQGKPLPTLAPLLKQVTAAVVNIAAFNQPSKKKPSRSAGSGVIINAEQGLVITNHHVIDGASEIQISLTDGRKFMAQRIGSDPEADLALLKIEADKLTELPLANSDLLQVGDFVVAIGNPFGLGQTVTTGIVSALGRTGLGIEGYENFIQTDASINPGNSGGALINLRGELVGINTAIIAPGGGNVGIGFAIPSNMTHAIALQLADNGEVRRGRLGVVVQDLSPELAEAFGLKDDEEGVLISEVAPGSAANKAGVKAGDVILKVNGEVVETTAVLRSQLGVWLIADSLHFDLLRDNKRFNQTVKLDQPGQGATEGKRYNPNLAGAVLLDSDNGVVIASIEPNSPAAGSGLRPGDQIESVNRQQIGNLDGFAKAADQKRSTLLLLINRSGNVLYLALPTDG
ncbi:MAG: Do family serine endopeptidase [Motiliproteus sp.]